MRVDVDLSQADHVAAAIRHAAPRVFFHLAAILDLSLGQRAASATYATNVLGTLHVVRAAQDCGCTRVVLAGSCAEYAASDLPLTEVALLAPDTPYAAAKTAAWALATGLCAGSVTSVMTIRLFTPYGPTEKTGRFVPAAILHCLSRTPMAMTTGRQARDYLYVDAAARAFLLAGAISTESTVVNVGSGREIALGDLAEIIAALTNCDPALFQRGALPTRSKERFHQCADTSRARQLLAWQPQVPLREGLLRTIAWYCDHGNETAI